jgi:SAM-dependent methyltransferase
VAGSTARTRQSSVSRLGRRLSHKQRGVLLTDYLSEQLKDMAPHRAILRAVECRLMGQVPLTPPVLDIGCGDGHFASIAYRDLPLDVGIDVMARDLAEAASRPGTYKQIAFASATALPFADCSYATVVSNCVIEHIPDNGAVLSEIARVLKPGGVFAATLPSEHFSEYLLGSSAFRRLGLPRLAQSYGEFFNRISHHYHVFPPEVWRDRLASAGLIVEDQKYYFSAAAHRRFDLSHYLGVPNLASKRLFGRWVLFRGQMKVMESWLRPYYEEPLPEGGAYQFVLARKVNRHFVAPVEEKR